MSQSNKFETAKKIIISLSSKLLTFEDEFPELVQFIEELENINFSLTHQLVRTIKPTNEILTSLNAIRLNSSNKKFGGLLHEDMTKFNWMKIYDGVDSKHSFINGMFASRLLGIDGYYASNRISAGLMLILPGVIYPFHTHFVKEFYYCLSGEILIRHDIDGEKLSLSEGKISLTPEGKLHSLEVIGKKPVLLIYSWLGNLNAPIRIWDKMNTESWEGYVWIRLPGQRWKRGNSQRLSNDDFLKSFSKYS